MFHRWHELANNCAATRQHLAALKATPSTPQKRSGPPARCCIWNDSLFATQRLGRSQNAALCQGPAPHFAALSRQVWELKHHPLCIFAIESNSSCRLFEEMDYSPWRVNKSATLPTGIKVFCTIHVSCLVLIGNFYVSANSVGDYWARSFLRQSAYFIEMK